jgi:hypothetical protein
MEPYLIIIAAYTLLLGTSGRIISAILKTVSKQTLEQVADDDVNAKNEATHISEEEKIKRIRIGEIIGKCENIIILTFIILDAYTAIAIVITAKTIVRKEEIEKNSMFFLAGTLINVCYSVVIGFILKLVLGRLGFHLDITTT